MGSGRKYPKELRERSLRMVTEARVEDAGLSLNQAVLRIGPRVGVNPDTLRGWVKQARIDAGEVPGETTRDAARLRALEQEVRELLDPYDVEDLIYVWMQVARGYVALPRSRQRDNPVHELPMQHSVTGHRGNVQVKTGSAHVDLGQLLRAAGDDTDVFCTRPEAATTAHATR